MHIEQENLSYKYDSDIIGAQIDRAVNNLNPSLALLDKASLYIVWAAVFGGAQIGVEASKIVNGTAGDKFPQGWDSFNITEEFLEGSIPAVVGAAAGKIIFKLICSTFPNDFFYNKHSEVMFMLAGSVMGYGTMQQLGFWLEQRLGIPDIKWGPFK
ncbi:MAG: hypothetical protein ABIJ05_04555 [Patescibacteria group bacterium]